MNWLNMIRQWFCKHKDNVYAGRIETEEHPCGIGAYKCTDCDKVLWYW